MAQWCQLENIPNLVIIVLDVCHPKFNPLETFYEEEHINLSCYWWNRKEIQELFAFEAQTKSSGISANSLRVIAFTSCFVVI